MKVLVVGLGGIGQRHVRNLHSLLGDDVDILAYRRRGLSRVLTDQLAVEPGADVVSRYRIRVFDSIEGALGERPDIALIANPSSLHVETALAAAKAGCHLFIEKPLSHSWEGVQRLLSLVDERNLVTLMGYQLRLHPCLLLVKRLLNDSAIGRPLCARLEVGEYMPYFHRYEDYRGMYAARKDLGGGVILSQIHELDLVYWFFGMPGRLFAVAGHWSDLEIDVEDVASLLLECEHDSRPLPVHVQQDYLKRPPSRTIEIVGTEGRIAVNLHEPEVKVFAKEGSCERHTFPAFDRNEMFLGELKHLLACVHGSEKSQVTVRDGAQSLRLALAAHESVRRGEAIRP